MRGTDDIIIIGSLIFRKRCNYMLKRTVVIKLGQQEDSKILIQFRLTKAAVHRCFFSK